MTKIANNCARGAECSDPSLKINKIFIFKQVSFLRGVINLFKEKTKTEAHLTVIVKKSKSSTLYKDKSIEIQNKSKQKSIKNSNFFSIFFAESFRSLEVLIHKMAMKIPKSNST